MSLIPVEEHVADPLDGQSAIDTLLSTDIATTATLHPSETDLRYSKAWMKMDLILLPLITLIYLFAITVSRLASCYLTVRYIVIHNDTSGSRQYRQRSYLWAAANLGYVGHTGNRHAATSCCINC